jgi:hypothetical protein
VAHATGMKPSLVREGFRYFDQAVGYLHAAISDGAGLDTELVKLAEGVEGESRRHGREPSAGEGRDQACRRLAGENARRHFWEEDSRQSSTVILGRDHLRDVRGMGEAPDRDTRYREGQSPGPVERLVSTIEAIMTDEPLPSQVAAKEQLYENIRRAQAMDQAGTLMPWEKAQIIVENSKLDEKLWPSTPVPTDEHFGGTVCVRETASSRGRLQHS